jgi:hypothetical protein
MIGDVELNNRHDPWFSMDWFRNCKDQATRYLNFYGEVHQLTDVTQYRIVISYTKKKVMFFRIISSDGKKNHYELAHEIRLLKDNRVRVGRRKAIRDPYIWAMAFKMKYLDYPPVWEKIGKWVQEEGTSTVLKRKDDKVCLYVIDKFGNHAYIPISHFNESRLDSLFNYYKRWRNNGNVTTT